jgi:hypothetical protein
LTHDFDAIPAALADRSVLNHIHTSHAAIAPTAAPSAQSTV